jgi:hypothetical protein
MLFCKRTLALIIVSLFPTTTALADTPAERGQKALFERPFTAAMWKLDAYENAWKQWDTTLKQAPKNYAEVFRERYGLHSAPFNNGIYPMGLREGSNFLGKGLTTDCMLCHAGSVHGKSYVGLGNSALDVQAFFEELAKASGGSGRLPHTFTNVRGTSEAGAMSVFLLSFREADLGLRAKPADLDLHDDMCEDVPAWWLLKKKKSMYHTGSANARSVRSIMQFMLTPAQGLDTFTKEEPVFADILAYILSLEPPRYPGKIDKTLAASGEAIFTKTCAKCHGTYGENWKYPNKIVSLKEIGTDPNRHRGISKKFGEHYNKTWFAKEKRADGKDGYPVRETAGYLAPPLDGIWATAPYFHNGSAPTVYDVLNSKTRPKIFTRSFRTVKDDYDEVKLGWKVRVLECGADPELPAIERRKIYDTTQPGRGNQGHTFGDHLSDAERMAVIEYLKSL